MYGVPQSSILGPPLFSLVLLFFFGVSLGWGLYCSSLLQPVGALNPKRAAFFAQRFESLADDQTPPYHYRRYCSTAASALHWLIRVVSRDAKLQRTFWTITGLWNMFLGGSGTRQWRRGTALSGLTGDDALTLSAERGDRLLRGVWMFFWGGFSVGNFPWKFTTLKMTFWEAYIGIFSLLSVCRLSFLSLDLSIHPSQAILQFHVWFWNFPVYPFEFPPSAIN